MDTSSKNLMVFFIALTGLCVQAAKKSAVTELTITPADLIKQGDTITITCKVTDKNRFDFVRIVRVVDGKEEEVQTNEFINDVFKTTDRYKNINYKEVGKNVETTVQITNAQGEDGGRIGCRLLPGDEGAYEDIKVHVPPHSVVLSYLGRDGDPVTVKDGGSLKLIRGTASAMMCKITVEGDDKVPNMRITMDGSDVTGRFQKNYLKDRKHEGGILQLKYTADFELRTDNANPSDNGKELACVAEMPHFPPKRTAAKIEVLYPPKLECDPILFAVVGSKNVKVSCKGKMNPPPVTTAWSFGKKPNRTVVMMGEKYDDVTAKMESLGDGEYEFSLVIDEVTEEHFRKYKLETSNSIATDDITLRLQLQEEVEKPQPKPDIDTEEGTAPIYDEEVRPNHAVSPRSFLIVTVLNVLTAICVMTS